MKHMPTNYEAGYILFCNSFAIWYLLGPKMYYVKNITINLLGFTWFDNINTKLQTQTHSFLLIIKLQAT